MITSSDSEMALTPLVTIVGATGLGKTALAIDLAERLNGEIINADSRQVYRRMDIGTAKPTREEQARIRHHLIDLVDPDYSLSLAEYQDYAYAAIADVYSRGKLPFLVGGTGQYISATIEGWRVPEVPPDPALRAELQAEAERMGAEALYARLIGVDPGAANLVDQRNVRRVIRALEVSLLSGQPFSTLRRKMPPPYRILEIGLMLDRAVLNTRLDIRIERMVDAGLLDEVRELLNAGYDRRSPSMSGLGYAQLSAYLAGEMTLAEAIEAFKRATHTFARRQMTWFTRHGAPHWIDMASIPPESVLHLVFALIQRWLTDTDNRLNRLEGSDVRAILPPPRS